MNKNTINEEIKKSTNHQMDFKIAKIEIMGRLGRDRISALLSIVGIFISLVGVLILSIAENLYRYELISSIKSTYIAGLIAIGYGFIFIFLGLSQSFLRTGDLNPFRKLKKSTDDIQSISVGADEAEEQAQYSESEPLSRTSLTKEEIVTRRLNSDVSRLERAIYTRLKAEIVDQGRKANSNLTFGTAAALIAFAILGLTIVIPPSETQNAFYAWSGFAARIMFSLTSSIFAFFFLTTYRRNLSEIRYFHNELTNIEMRTLAFRRYMTGVIPKSETADVLIAEMLTSLVRTERNFVLRKGESTTDLSQKELDRDEQIAWVSGITAAMTKSQLINPPRAFSIHAEK